MASPSAGGIYDKIKNQIRNTLRLHVGKDKLTGIVDEVLSGIRNVIKTNEDKMNKMQEDCDTMRSDCDKMRSELDKEKYWSNELFKRCGECEKTLRLLNESVGEADKEPVSGDSSDLTESLASYQEICKVLSKDIKEVNEELFKAKKEKDDINKRLTKLKSTIGMPEATDEEVQERITQMKSKEKEAIRFEDLLQQKSGLNMKILKFDDKKEHLQREYKTKERYMERVKVIAQADKSLKKADRKIAKIPGAARLTLKPTVVTGPSPGKVCGKCKKIMRVIDFCETCQLHRWLTEV